MKPSFLQLIVIVSVLILLSIGGANVSLKIRSGALPMWTQYAFTVGLALVWSYMVKSTQWSLLFSSALYDIVVSSTWLLIFAVQGDPMTLKQKIGFILALVGVILLA